MDDSDAIKAFFGLEIDDAVLLALTISHASIQPLYVVNNAPMEDGSGNIVSRGNEYIAYPFDFDLPGNADDIPRANIRIANVPYKDLEGNLRRVSDSLKNLDTSPLITFEILRASNPNSVLLRFPRFELTLATWDIIEVTGVLTQASYASEPFGFIRVTPQDFPAMFRS